MIIDISQTKWSHLKLLLTRLHCTLEDQLSITIPKGCQDVLEDLNSLVEKYNSLSSSNLLQRVKLGTEDITTLRIRLISNTGLLNGFIQRFDISVVAIEYSIMLISPSQMRIM